ncbi:MAG: hypothetical protein K0R55_1708 [Sporomusa sp.]|nr:hypothetical protein [Sporomusa sp.]
MNLPGVSSLPNNSASCGRTEPKSEQDSSDNSQGWKYATVKVGDTVYTYIVIGKNMKVLIGATTDDEEKGKDKKTVSGKNDANTTDKLNETKYSDSNKIGTDKVDFLMDHRMLGLTGFYQKKLRDMVENMEDQIIYNKIDYIDTKTKFKSDPAEISAN